MGGQSSLHELSVRVKTRMGLERFKIEKSQFWSRLKLAENRAASSLWIVGPPQEGILLEPKLVWI